MSAEDILKGLGELESLVGSRRRDALFGAWDIIWTPTSITGSIHRSDWRPVWNKAREIQELFNGKPHFPTRDEREAAWMRFNALRNEAGELRDSERSDFEAMSNFYRGGIMSDIKPLFYHAFSDKLLGPILGHDTAEEMKACGAKLNEIARYFSENKNKLLPEHKQEIHNYIQECRESHQQFWGAYGRQREQARAERAAKHAAFETRTRERIAQNRQRLAKAEHALERQRDHMSDLRDKLSDARSSEYAARVSGWIDEAEQKMDDIREHIRRVSGWIDEDEQKLR